MVTFLVLAEVYNIKIVIVLKQLRSGLCSSLRVVCIYYDDEYLSGLRSLRVKATAPPVL